MRFFSRIWTTYRKAYSGLPREAWLLSLIEFLNRSGYMVFFFITLHLTRNLSVSPARAGLALSAFGVGSLGGSLLGGWLSDRIGPFRVQKLSLMLNGLFLILLGQLHHFESILGLMMVLGLVSEALHPANATAMSRVCPPEIRTRGFALNRLATNLGITIGPALGGILAMINYELLFWVDGLTCLVAAGVFMVILPGRAPVGNGSRSDRETEPIRSRPYRDPWFLALFGLTFLMVIGFVQLFNTFPLYMRNVYSLKESMIGLLLSINTLIIVFFEMILLERLKHRKINHLVAMGALLLGGGFALMPLGKGFAWAGFTVIVWTFGEMLSMPALTTMVANHAPDACRGRYMGMFSLAFALGFLVGPALGAWVYGNLGPNWLWYGQGLLGILLFFAFRRLSVVSSEKGEGQMASG